MMKTLKIRIVNNHNKIKFVDKVEAIKKELIQKYKKINCLKFTDKEVVFVCK